jgi:hypothetical protein
MSVKGKGKVDFDFADEEVGKIIRKYTFFMLLNMCINTIYVVTCSCTSY